MSEDGYQSLSKAELIKRLKEQEAKVAELASKKVRKERYSLAQALADYINANLPTQKHFDMTDLEQGALGMIQKNNPKSKAKIGAVNKVAAHALGFVVALGIVTKEGEFFNFENLSEAEG